MKINNLGVSTTPLTSQAGTPAAASPTSQSGAAPDAGGYFPSAELVKLISLVGLEPEVRPESVQAAINRLDQGHFHTPTAAAATASAMLDSAD